MGWNRGMAEAYEAGLVDGKAGVRRGCPNDFLACYEQGWAHGQKARAT